jgi:hypothetical protein
MPPSTIVSATLLGWAGVEFHEPKSRELLGWLTTLCGGLPTADERVVVTVPSAGTSETCVPG